MKKSPFLFSALGSVVVFGAPILAASLLKKRRPNDVSKALQNSQLTFDANEEEEKLVSPPPTIAELEAIVASQSLPFPWEAHNELRHLYVVTDEAKSMSHADAILRHSFMDEYILDVLSGWHMDTDKQRAIVALTEKIERFGDLLCLRAAGLIRVGDIYEQLGQSARATASYRELIQATETHWDEAALQPYLKLAHSKLSF